MTTASPLSALYELRQGLLALFSLPSRGNAVSHVFDIGRLVTVKLEATNGIPLGVCQVLRTLPMSYDDQPRYHVKCGADGRVRAMPEEHLEAAGEPDLG